MKSNEWPSQQHTRQFSMILKLSEPDSFDSHYTTLHSVGDVRCAGIKSIYSNLSLLR
ncbi:hypothetical protein [Microcoleus sp. FACHB-672]|uniref:hypothetical protein n=1 Tax=Microcoleus sp. FACHB-672 TaxID=2692825 RepID=UPI00168979B4|nr:hypothetical protein [Microcoleus sp. FACHB-672]MBD2043823.1 hypothetical protein [Microcoleus sp. FACHB-672]